MAQDGLRFLDLQDVRTTIAGPRDILDKELGIYQYVSYMLDRTNKMFEWKGLPDTIPARMLELYLQINGYASFVQIDEQMKAHYPSLRSFKEGVYCFFGGIGGERDIYYRPLLFTLANPRLKEAIQCSIIYSESDDFSQLKNPCVVMRNDTNFIGLLPMFNRYAAQMVENDISIRSAQINARAQVGISVNNDAEAETARKYLDDLEAGKLAVIAKANFLQGVSVANVGTQSANIIIQLIELQQYLKASWFNDLGLNSNFNMKREYISREEIGSQTDVLLPLVDDMLEARKEAAELINKVFGFNITVEKNSAWADKDQTIINSLGAGAAEGNVPFIGDVADRIEEEGDVQLVRDSEGEPQGTGEGTSESSATEGSSVGTETEVRDEEPAAQAETVPENGIEVELGSAIIEATAERVAEILSEEGGETSESETQEKSDESDG